MSHTTELSLSPDVRRALAQLAGSSMTELRGNTPPQAPHFSLSRLLSELPAETGLRDGHEAGVCRAAATLRGEHYDQHRPVIPFTALRDLTAGTASAGGYVVGTDVGAAVDVLRPWSVTAAAGATILTNLVGNLALPRVTTAATAGWISTEGTNAPQNEPALGQAAMSPKAAGAYARYSRQVNIQSAQTEPFVRAQLLEAVGALLDQAIIAGSGTAGQPQGIVGTTGVGTQSGTSLAFAGLRAMRKGILAAGGREDRVAWIGGLDVHETLGGRERTTNAGRYLWDDDGILGRPAYATANCTATTLVAGDWSRCIVGVWGPGFTVEVNPYANFQAGIIAARIIVECDVLFTHAAAFNVSTSVT